MNYDPGIVPNNLMSYVISTVALKYNIGYTDTFNIISAIDYSRGKRLIRSDNLICNYEMTKVDDKDIELAFFVYQNRRVRDAKWLKLLLNDLSHITSKLTPRNDRELTGSDDFIIVEYYMGINDEEGFKELIKSPCIEFLFQCNRLLFT